jgi:hypothetical protein
MGTILTYQYRYRNLFISLISLIMIYPFMQDMDDLRIFFNFFVSWLLFTSAAAIIQDRKQFRMVMLLGVPTFIFSWTDIFLAVHWINLIYAVFLSSFFALITWNILVSVIAEGQGKVTRDRMIGAFCGYILLGITWATFYYLLESFSPGSFNNTRELLISSGESSLPRITVELADFVYFSLVTLTTLGYGDILPVNRQAKSLAIMEAMAGVMYLAVLVARFANNLVLDQSKQDPTQSNRSQSPASE